MPQSNLPAVLNDSELLLKYNKFIYGKLKNAFESSNKIYFEHATGLGKTYICMQTIVDSAIEHHQNLLQNAHNLSLEKKRKLNVLFVCPTDVIRDYFTETIEEQLETRPKTKELWNNSINLSTSLYAGLKSHGKYDLIIFDEMHRLGAKTWGPVAKELLENNPQAKVLGMTATPERTDDPESAYISKLFNNSLPVTKTTVTDAIVRGLLPCPNYIVAKIKSLQKNNGEFEAEEAQLTKLLKQKNTTTEERAEIKELLKEIKFAKSQIAQTEDLTDAVAEQFNAYASQGKNLTHGKFIVFCPMGNTEDEDIHRMQQIMSQCEGWFSKCKGVSKITKYQLYSNHGKAKNRQQLQDFQSNENSDGVKILFAVNMLNEGLHAGNIDGVFMLRETSSPIIYLQQLGRVLSAGKRKDSTPPLVFDLVQNINKNTLFVQSLANSINSQREHFENKNYLHEHNIKFTLQISQNVQFLQDLQNRINAVIHNNDFEFGDFYNRLRRIVESGKSLGDIKQIDTDPFDSSYHLGQKISSIRTGIIKLNNEQIMMLNDIGFVWDATPTNKFEFNDFYNRLLRIIQSGKSLGDIKQIDTDPFDPSYPLGVKFSYVRSDSGRKVLDGTQIQMLNDIGFVWSKKDPTTKFEFNDFYNRLLRIVQSGKSLGDIKQRDADPFDPSYPLGKKFSYVRRDSVRKNLDDTQIQMLNDIGFVWSKKDPSKTKPTSTPIEDEIE